MGAAIGIIFSVHNIRRQRQAINDEMYSIQAILSVTFLFVCGEGDDILIVMLKRNG